MICKGRMVSMALSYRSVSFSAGMMSHQTRCGAESSAARLSTIIGAQSRKSFATTKNSTTTTTTTTTTPTTASSKNGSGFVSSSPLHGSTTTSKTNIKRRRQRVFRTTSKPQHSRKQLDDNKTDQTDALNDVSKVTSARTMKAYPILQPSSYSYTTPFTRSSDASRTSATAASSQSSRMVLPILDASAVLNPLKYCKKTSRLSFNRNGVNRSISGTDAARRLLRGKKEFMLAARSLKTKPALVEGHGVPPQLFQHCIDMADALLLQYSPDVVECTFHNYNYVTDQSKLPKILRIRSRDGTNRCTPWPPERAHVVEDWDYHLELYLRVMERMTGHLGMVVSKKPTEAQTISSHQDKKNSSRSNNTSHVTNDDDMSTSDNEDGDELTSSPFLFTNANTPHWSVDILRGTFYDLHVDGTSSGNRDDATNDRNTMHHTYSDIPPAPLVEFTKESATTGHVIVRLQGVSSTNNPEFGSQHSRQPVTLVFDACYRTGRN